MAYFLHILISINLYISIAISLNLIAGYTGMLSIAHVAFYGVSAYVAAMVVAGAVAAIVAFSLGIHDDYLVIAKFGCQVILFSIFNNWVGLTYAWLGISSIPQPRVME